MRRSRAGLGAIPAGTTRAVPASATFAEPSALEAHEAGRRLGIASHPLVAGTLDIARGERADAAAHTRRLRRVNHDVVAVGHHGFVVVVAAAGVGFHHVDTGD